MRRFLRCPPTFRAVTVLAWCGAVAPAPPADAQRGAQMEVSGQIPRPPG